MRILQRNLKRNTFVVREMKRNVSVVCVCSAPNCCISGKIIIEMPGSVVSGTHLFFIHFIIKRPIHSTGDQDGVVCTASCYGLDCPGFELRWRQDISSCPYRPWGPPDSIYDGHWGCFLGIKRPGRDVNHQSNSEVEIALSCTPTPLVHVCMLWIGLYRGMLLVQY